LIEPVIDGNGGQENAYTLYLATFYHAVPLPPVSFARKWLAVSALPIAGHEDLPGI
jgi:hypothetical protein